MSETYKRLSQDFAPLDDVQGLALPSNSRQLKSWINELPRGNPKETATMLYSSLVHTMAEKLSGPSRFNQLEEVRNVTVDSIAWLERQFIGTSMPLVNERLSFAQTALNLHIVLADSYRLASYELCSPHGSIPMLKTASVNAALQRSIWHYQQSLKISWKLYRSSNKNVWLGTHRIYHFAKQLKLERKSIADPLMAMPVNIYDLYCEMALVSLMNPLAFAQAEQDNLFKLAASFAPQCNIGVNQLTEQWTKLPIDADSPVDCNLPDDEVIYLSFQGLSNAVEGVQSNSGIETLDLVLIDGKSLTLPVSLLLKVKRALGLAMERGFTRHFVPYSIETIVGLNNIHYYAAGRLDFDNYIQQLPQASAQGLSMTADWLGRAPDTSAQRPIDAGVQDHSLSGYRIIWENEPLLRVRVGEVIGLNVMRPEPDWMVGIIRWLQYEQNGSIIAGVELLTRRCHSVALNIHKGTQTKTVVRGLKLEPLDENLPFQLLMSGRQQSQKQKLDVFYSYEPNRIGGGQLTETIDSQTVSLDSNLEYSLLTVLV